MVGRFHRIGVPDGHDITTATSSRAAGARKGTAATEATLTAANGMPALNIR